MSRKFFLSFAFLMMLFSVYFSANAAITEENLIVASKEVAHVGIQLTSISLNRDVIVVSGKDANNKLYTYFYNAKTKKWQDLNSDTISPVSGDLANTALTQMTTIIMACKNYHLSLISAQIDGKEGHYSCATRSGDPMMGHVNFVE